MIGSFKTADCLLYLPDDQKNALNGVAIQNRISSILIKIAYSFFCLSVGMIENQTSHVKSIVQNLTILDNNSQSGN